MSSRTIASTCTAAHARWAIRSAPRVRASWSRCLARCASAAAGAASPRFASAAAKRPRSHWKCAERRDVLLSPEQVMIRDTVREFARGELAPNAARWDREHTFPREALRGLAALGVMGMVVDERWGGAGLDYVSLALAMEEVAAGDGATSTIVGVQNSVVCGPIEAFGSDEQKAKYLPGLARGELLGCFCLTEPGVGSDAAAISTRAERRGDGWVINGVKQFSTSGKNADVAIVFAVTDRAAG